MRSFPELVAMDPGLIGDIFEAMPAAEGVEKLRLIGERALLLAFVKKFKNA